MIRAIDTCLINVSDKTSWIFLRVSDEDGHAGYGEATRFGAEDAVLAEIDRARALIVGKALPVPGGVLAALHMVQTTDARQAVVNAIEQALLDLMARRAKLPMAELLGGPFRQRVPCYANINRGTLDRSPAGFAQRAKTISETQGYTAIKIAPFDGLHWSRVGAAEGRRLLNAGIERIAAVRNAIGPDALLMVDCHWRLSPIMALSVLAATRNDKLFWLEDALDEKVFSAEDLRRVRSAANAIGVRTAGGEKLTDLAGMHSLLAGGGSDVMLPDLRITGIREAMGMLALAAARGAEVSLHNPVGPVLDAISLQVAAALPSLLILEGQVAESHHFDEIAGGPRQLEGGERVLPSAPGSGIEPKLMFSKENVRAPSQRVATFAGMAGAGPDA